MLAPICLVYRFYMWPVLTYCTFNLQWRPVSLPRKLEFSPHKSHLGYLPKHLSQWEPALFHITDIPSTGSNSTSTLRLSDPRGQLILQAESNTAINSMKDGTKVRKSYSKLQVTSYKLQLQLNKLMAAGTNECQGLLAAILYTLKWVPEVRVWKSECSRWSALRRNAWAWL